ncbi:autotransporter outer membrane beta-barrel domain-containing protein [Fusobacterium ulcerans]|uniref:autotransporter domain-containing protein n=1 Tax=Fusobacterium ulcerans TaxID=861 RepID=UPI000E475B1B|nr:autotransporter outer membrane beta-barrel domain-containing protein [Fusobacterium ulcerans]RGY67263.1 autotransporter outer membrane beta-barrel domain-containing protein [Fusobacterium ulcerans]
MIEKIMKAVKSENKKRGRNITIGTVVGMLLSCTFVMGATTVREDVIELNIANDGSGIKFDKVFPENSWKENIYTNNAIILGESSTGTENRIGIKIDGGNKETNLTLVNNNTISGKSTHGNGYGILMEHLGEGSKFKFINNGVVSGESSATDPEGGYGIYISGNKDENIDFSIQNNGLIIGKSLHQRGYGVYISNLKGGSFVNNGTISGVSSGETGSGYGIYLNSVSGNEFTLENNGLISGDGLISGKSYNSYGICGSTSNIGTLKNNGLILVLGGNSNYGIYMVTGSSARVLENNGLILAKNTGIYLIGNTKTLTNEGSILGNSSGITIPSDGGTINGDAVTIANKGMILTRSTGGEYKGIAIYGSSKVNDRVGTLTNDGLISAKGNDKSLGMQVSSSGKVGNIISNGLILSNGTGIRATAATNEDKGKIGNIVNNGAISAEKYGIAADPTNNNGGFIDKIVNTGVIYGKTNAVKKIAGGTTAGEIESTTNYGILVNGANNDVVDVAGKTLQNYGLIIKNTDNTATVTAGNVDISPKGVIVGYKRTVESGTAKDTPIKRNLTIKNAGIIGGTSGNATNSFIFSTNEKEYDNSILNGMNDTLKISGANVNREVKGSIINAYGNAVKFDGENQKKLTLSGTIVNGGIKDGAVAIKGSSGADTLILQSENVGYTDGTTGSQNTIINGNIDMGNGANSITLKTDTIVNGSITTGTGADTLNIESGAINNGNIVMGAGADTLTIGSGAIINGTLNGGTDTAKSTSENNTLNFDTADSSNSEETRVFYDISNFENMNIDSNVTFYEKTTDKDGKAKDLEVTGAKKIKIGADGTLTLRIDATEMGSSADDGKIVGHALYGNTGTITSEGGKLVLALNGAGNESIISFGGTTLGNGLDSNTLDTTSILHTIKKTGNNEVLVTVKEDLIPPSGDIVSNDIAYEKLNKIYHSIISVDDLINNFNVDDEGLVLFLDYLNNIYAGNPYSYSSELSRKSVGMFRDIVTDNQFKANTGKWMIYGGLTHIDGGTKDTYYGKGYYTYDVGSSDMDADTKITGAYMLGEYGVSDTLTSGVVIGGNKLKSDLSNGSKVDGSAMYLGAYAKKYVGNLKVTAGAGFQYGDYDADRMAVNKVASDTEMSVMKYSDNYNDITYDIYLNGRYSHQVGDSLFLEPYTTLSYTYIDQDGANEGSKTLAIETDSKSFDYTVGKVGVDLKKVIPHEKGKSTLSAGVSYTKMLDGADEEHITGRFKGGSDFDILVAHKNEHSIGLNAKYALELENGVIFDVKGTYSVERDSHNQSGKNRTKGEWIVGAGLGYKF